MTRGVWAAGNEARGLSRSKGLPPVAQILGLYDIRETTLTPPEHNLIRNVKVTGMRARGTDPESPDKGGLRARPRG